MTYYNLNGLNPKDFEHLTQALAKSVINSAVTPFGDGPDGGREATYDGQMSYRAPAAWNGYLVIQCKYRAKSEGASSDSKWALKELEKEFKSYGGASSRRKKRRVPDYYIFVTNVILTAAQSGGKDKVREFLEGAVKKGILKGFDVWSYDELCRFLDGDSNIRRAYAGFITPGDVLDEAIKLLDLKKEAPDFSEAMLTHLQKEFLADFGTKLESASKSSSPISLSRVFVDLPISPNTNLSRFASPEGEQVCALSYLLKVGSMKLNATDVPQLEMEGLSVVHAPEQDVEWEDAESSSLVS